MKKSIKAIFFFSALLTCQYSTSQSCDSFPFQHIYYNQGFHETHIKSFSFTSQSDLLLTGFVNQDQQQSNVDGWMMRTTFHGTPLWSKAIGTTADETINGIKSTRDGGFIFVGSTKYNSLYETGWLGKVDSSGNPLWSIELTKYYGSLSQIVELKNGDLVAVGTLYLKFNGDTKGNIVDISRSSNFIIRLDGKGNLIWQRSFYHSSREGLNKAQTLMDGNLLVTGNVTGSDTGYIIKLDQFSGKTIWMNGYAITRNYNFARITENTDRTLKFKTGNRTYYFTSDGKYNTGSYEIDISSHNKPIQNGQIEDVGSEGQSEIYYANIKPTPILFSVVNGTTVQWAHTYIFGSSGSVSLGGTRIVNNNIYLSGSYKTSNVSDTTSNEQLTYLLKATSAGEALCFDTANVAFKIVNIQTVSNTSYAWMDEGTVTPEFISLYSKTIQPALLLDCSQQTCCKDVIITRNEALCDNGIYKLPDGTMATKPGFYTTRTTTFTGCDSIIYTNLTQQSKISFSLAKDTCLIDNQPVTFVLKNDSTVHYYWSNGITGNQFTAFMPGEYWVTAISECNAVSDTVKVFADCAQPVFIPSAFTPNNDGLNDVFRVPEISGQHLAGFNIYNRYGQLIFHSEDVGKGWDGTKNDVPQPAGTYIYLIEYFDLLHKPHLLKGTLTLIR